MRFRIIAGGIAAATLFLFLSASCPATAGSPRQDPSAGGTVTVPADVRKILGQASDLDYLNVLAPLKLTADQVDKWGNALKAIAQKDEETRKKDYEAVRALAGDIEKARNAAIRGEAVDHDFTTRLAKTNAEMAARSDQAHQDAASKMTTVLKETLLDRQGVAIQEQYLQYLKDTKSKLSIPSRLRNNAAGTQEFIRDSAVSWFVERVLLNDRVPAMLTALRPKDTSTTAASTPPPAAGDGGNPATPPPSKP